MYILVSSVWTLLFISFRYDIECFVDVKHVKIIEEACASLKKM